MRLSQENENRQGTPSTQTKTACRSEKTDSLSFPKKARLLKSSDFHRVKKFGRRFVGQVATFTVLPEKIPYPRLGLTVSRHFGTAVIRNRFKRRVREAFRLSQHQLPSASIHVAPLKSGSMPTVQQLLEDFTHAKC